MFAVERDRLLDALGRMGARVCSYTLGTTGADWLGGTCDCKYGGAGFSYQPRGTFGGLPIPYSGEGTGCPELRLIYHVLAAMSDEQWKDAYTQAGGVDGREVAEAILRKLNEESS